MTRVNNESEKYFSVDGIFYAKIYQPLKKGSESIGLHSVFDTGFAIFDIVGYSDIEINGTTYDNQEDALEALLVVTFNLDFSESTNTGGITLADVAGAGYATLSEASAAIAQAIDAYAQNERLSQLLNDYSELFGFDEATEVKVATGVLADSGTNIINLPNDEVLDTIGLINRPNEEVVVLKFVNPLTGDYGFQEVSNNFYSDIVDNTNGEYDKLYFAPQGSSSSYSSYSSYYDELFLYDDDGNSIEDNANLMLDGTIAMDLYFVSVEVIAPAVQEDYNQRNIEFLKTLVPYEGAVRDVNLGSNSLILQGQSVFGDTFFPISILTVADTGLVFGTLITTSLPNASKFVAIGKDVFVGGTSAVTIGSNSKTNYGGDISIGNSAGSDSSNVSGVLIGNGAGFGSQDVDFVTFIGHSAGQFYGDGSENFLEVTLVGRFAGLNGRGSRVTGIGNRALWGNTGSDVVGLGNRAGLHTVNNTTSNSNTKSNATIIHNDNLPAYADRAAAVADLSIANGCVEDNTYMYYNESTFAVEAVRL